MKGAIVGAGLVSHVPPLVMPEAIRRLLNNGEDTTLYQGLHDLGAERLGPLSADTVVVVDTPLVHHRRAHSDFRRPPVRTVHVRRAAPGHEPDAL